MKIIIICNEYPPTSHGGIGVIVKDLAEGLIEYNHEVAVIGYDPLVRNNQQQLENGVLVTRLKLKKFRHLRIGRYVLSLEPILSRKYLSLQLEELIKSFRPDLVESFDWSGPLWKKPSVKTIVRLHGANTANQVYEKNKPSRILAYFERKNVEFADALCAVSKHIGDLTLRALNLEHKGFACLYNFVNTERFRPLEGIGRDPFKLLYVGRLHPRKGLTELFLVLKELFQLNPNVYLELAGPYQEAYKEELMHLLPVENQTRVAFLGKLPHAELPAIINSARLLVMPSRAEAFGLTAIEAMACGTAAMLTNKASGPEIVDEGKTGWLIDINNPVESAIKINNLLHQQHLMNQVAGEGRNHVLRYFSKEVVLAQNVDFYQSLLV